MQTRILWEWNVLCARRRVSVNVMIFSKYLKRSSTVIPVDIADGQVLKNDFTFENQRLSMKVHRDNCPLSTDVIVLFLYFSIILLQFKVIRIVLYYICKS